MATSIRSNAGGEPSRERFVKVTRQLAWKAALICGLTAGLTALIPGRLGLGFTPVPYVQVLIVVIVTAILTGSVFMIAAGLTDRTIASLLRKLAGTSSNEGISIASQPSWIREGITQFENALSERVKQSAELQSQLREAELRRHVAEAERTHLEDILQGLKDAVVVTDGFDEIVLANESASRLLHFSLDKALNEPVNTVVNDHEIVQFIQDTRVKGNLASRRLIEHEMTDQSEPRHLEISLSCIPNQNQQSGGVVTILHDVTRERQISELKTDFVSKASHELRTPLSLIKAYVEMLIDGEAETDETRNEFYHIIQTEANRLERLINNMLNISRIESGISQGEWQETDLKDIIDEVVDLAKPRAAEKNISISHKRGQLCTVAEIDRDMLHQVIMNLVSNAIKYSPEGGRVTLSTALSDCDRSVMVTVADTGLGIPPDAVEHLFDKFYRIKNYNRIATGTGLGLNLVKQVVERIHGGEVGVDSELGMGSKFWFTVPCKRPS